jgi:NAD(P)-dependent dehydrogenase (short-subunit alcohol dehydrogenase family)
VVWEDLWVTAFAEAVAQAGGQVVAHDRVPEEVVSAALAAASAESGPA